MATGSTCFSQETDTVPKLPYIKRWDRTYDKTELLLGIHFQGNWKDDQHAKGLRYAELGIARSRHTGNRHGIVSYGAYLSEEIHLGDQAIYGTKLGAYMHALFDIGLAFVYYTDFKRGNFKIRPELGFGVGAFRVAAGYNIPTIDNKAFDLLRRKNAQLSIQFLLPVKKKWIDKDPIQRN